MKTTLRRGRPAFTLIELMAVITIIVILAGLVVGGLSFVTERQAKEKARAQLALLQKALDDYKLDNGEYPPTPDSPDGSKNSDELFVALYYDSDGDGQGAASGSGTGDEDQKIYLGELDPASSKQGWTTGTPSATTIITDPWGNEYRYRSAKNASGTDNPSTQNPDFDLWSTGKDGKTNPSAMNDESNRDDIKNF